MVDLLIRRGLSHPLKICVMIEKNEPRKRGQGGRPPKNDPATHRLTVNLTDEQYARFLSMFEQSGVASISGFIAARIFGDEFRVVKTDASALEFTSKLTALHGQFRSIGVNYNQILKQLYTTFGEKKALAMLFTLEQETIGLSKIGQQVLKLCGEFREKVL